jgi:prevent-host-death family protein
METIAGVRDLKNKLSHYLREFKKGRSVMITERGKLIAIIVPAQQHPDVEKLKKLARSGLGTSKGGGPKVLLDPSWLKGNRWEISCLRSGGDSLLGSSALVKIYVEENQKRRSQGQCQAN